LQEDAKIGAEMVQKRCRKMKEQKWQKDDWQKDGPERGNCVPPKSERTKKIGIGGNRLIIA